MGWCKKACNSTAYIFGAREARLFQQLPVHHCAALTCDHLYLVITVPADGLAPYGARPSAGTVLTKMLWDPG